MAKDRDYRPDIDGLRAIAVLSVLIFHAGLGLPGGFVGVDVFFVISGYLITGIIIRELSDGRFTMANFWARRIRRILPASTVVTVVALVACGFVMMPKAFDETARSALAHSVASANIFFWKLLGYFEERGETRPLLHMWSLAVEEQFYICFPVLLMIAWKRTTGAVWVLLIGIWVVSLTGSIVGLNLARSSTFYLLPGRAWELGTGALLAFAEFQGVCRSDRCPSAWKQAASWIGIGLIAAACIGYSPDTPFPGANALPPCLGAGLVIWSQSGGPTVVGRALSWSPLRLIGKASFSLYLWHWPIFALLRYAFQSELPEAVSIGALGLTLACSLASWRYVETPFREAGARLSAQRIITAGIGISAILAAVAGILIATGGLADRVPGTIARIGVGTVAPDSEAPTVPGGFRAKHASLPTVGATSKADSVSKVLLWGDSHAGVVSPLFHEIGNSLGTKYPVAIMHGIAPLEGMWAEGTQDPRVAAAVGEVLKAIEILRPIRVIMVARWSVHLGRATDGSGDRPLEVCRHALRRTIERLRGAGVGEIIICGEVPRQIMTPPQVAIRAWWFGFDPLLAGVSLQQHALEQVESRKLLDFAAELEGVRVIDLGEACFDEQGVAHAQDAGGTLYTDDDHLDLRGARLYLRGAIEPLLRDPQELR
jgi:peptidoglycan/LPS O-acetylase OafA/YrhL